MRWHDLAFLHWPVEAALMRRAIPSQLELDCYGGQAWIGLVPFEMRETRFRGVPDLSATRQFFECNVRTYVKHAGRSGVWFFSLDAEHLLPVIGARALWSLPYEWSTFDVARTATVTDYALRRRWGDGASHVVWERGESLPPALPGSLAHFLTERYYLFSQRFGRILRGRVAHPSWPLREARVLSCEDGLVRAAGIEVSGEPIAWCTDGVDVEGWSLVRSELPAAADGSTL